jgi:hypothetical protein
MDKVPEHVAHVMSMRPCKLESTNLVRCRTATQKNPPNLDLSSNGKTQHSKC